MSWSSKSGMRPLPYLRNSVGIRIRLTGSGVALRFLVATGFASDYGLYGLVLFRCDAVTYCVANDEGDYGHPCFGLDAFKCHEDGHADEAYEGYEGF